VTRGNNHEKVTAVYHQVYNKVTRALIATKLASAPVPTLVCDYLYPLHNDDDNNDNSHNKFIM